MRAAAAFLVLLLAVFPAAAQDFPPLTGRVVDSAGIIPDAEEAALGEALAAIEAETSDQVVVATLPSLDGRAIEEYGVDLARAWGIGQAGEDNGVLLLVAPNEREVRIEVGYGLEGTLTDAISRLIIEGSILPRFRAGDYPGGIRRGVEDIDAVLTGDAQAFAERARERASSEDTLGAAFTVFVFMIILFVWLSSFGGGGRGRGRRRRGGVLMPGGFAGRSRGSFGGGFSGGGGSFGGGGASGRW